MGKVHLDKTMSLDGFIAGPNDDVTRLFEWYGLFEHLGTLPIELGPFPTIVLPGAT